MSFQTTFVIGIFAQNAFLVVRKSKKCLVNVPDLTHKLKLYKVFPKILGLNGNLGKFRDIKGDPRRK